MNEVRIKALLTQSPGIDVLASLIAIDPMTLSPSGRVDYLAVLERQGGWLQALMQKAIVAVAGAEPEFDGGTYSGVDDPQREEVATALNLAPITAQTRIDVARTLTQHLPATCSALANGEISSAQATVIAKESSALLRVGIDSDQLKFIEATAIAYSEFHTPAQVAQKVRSIVAKMEPAEFEVAVAQASQARRVTFSPQPHGMAQIMALLPAIQAQTVWLAIDKLARTNKEKSLISLSEVKPLFHEATDSSLRGRADGAIRGGADGAIRGRADGALPEFIISNIEPFTLDQLRADALATIAEQFLSTTADQNLAHGRPVTLNLTLDLPTYLGLKENPGILAGYGEIPASAARLLASDAKWRRFITDPVTGNLLDYGRSTYEPPQALVDFVVARDRRCRFPGCRQPSRLCDIDHAVPWEEGGKTSTGNLGLLCRRHHRMKTHGGWKLISFEDGSCEWTSPEGKVFHVEPRRIDEVV
jgi:hypothetical protein